MSLIIARCIIASEEHILASLFMTSLPCCESHPNVRSTTQRRGSSSKPSALSLRRTISSSTFRCLGISDTHWTSFPAYPPSAHTLRIHPNAVSSLARTSRAPSRSWTEAEWTTQTSTRPSVSTSICRLIPLTLFPASYPRRPGRPAERTLCESMIAAVGAFFFRCGSARILAARRGPSARLLRPSTSRSSGSRSATAAGPWASSSRRCRFAQDRRSRRARAACRDEAAARASKARASEELSRSIPRRSGRLDTVRFPSTPPYNDICAKSANKMPNSPLFSGKPPEIDLLDSL